MQSRETRFWLRFDAGARQGDRVALPSGAATVGRRADNPIVVSHSSVSGRHAELRIEGEEVTLVDLGSTNGTRVGGEKVSECRLAHGDRIIFGSVQAIFLDDRMGAEPEVLEIHSEPAFEMPEDIPGPAPAPGPAPTAAAAGVLGHVSADRVASSAPRSRIGWALIVLLIASSGLFAWRFLGREQREREQVFVAAVAGDLLTNNSFEEEREPWTSADAAPQAFFRDASFARRGRSGMGVVLAAGEWALALSPELGLRRAKFLELRAALAPDDGVAARVGLELSSTADAAPTFVAWAPATTGSGDWQDVLLGFDSLPGYDRARVVIAVRAAAEGAVAVDDVSVVNAGEVRGPAATHEEYDLYVLGDPASTLALVRSGRTILAGVGFDPWGIEGLPGNAGSRWSVRANETGFVLTASGVEAAAALAVRANGRDPWNGARGELLFATIGEGGYVAHSSSFERERATDLLLGRGVNLMRVGLGAPVSLVGNLRQGTLHIRIGPAAPAGVEFQLSFEAQRVTASDLAREARRAVADGRLGRALAAWSTLLDEVPFDAELIAEAERERASLVQAGHARVDEVREKLRRAGFFQLPELFDACRSDAEEIASSYGGTEVEADARELVTEAEGALAALTHGQEAGQSERLSAVLEALDGAAHPLLSEHVRAALAASDNEAND